MAVLTDEAVISRVESPMNLLQRLRSTSNHKEQLIVSLPPKLGDIIPDLDDKLATNNSRSKALSVMNKALNRLDDEIDNIRGDKLPGIINQMANAIKATEEQDKEDKRVQFIVYSPTIMKEADFGEVIEVKE